LLSTSFASGIDVTTIALWLGHDSPESSRPYLNADLQLKQRALDRTAVPHTTRVATAHPTNYSPSSKDFNYAELPG
jgi:hypothetical protein